MSPLKLLLIIIVLALPLVPTFWSILDIPKRKFSSRRVKAVWFVLVASLPFVGGMIYILLVRKNTQPASTSDAPGDGTASKPKELNQSREEIGTDA